MRVGGARQWQNTLDPQLMLPWQLASATDGLRPPQAGEIRQMMLVSLLLKPS
jgi:hypothetical protein